MIYYIYVVGRERVVVEGRPSTSPPTLLDDSLQVDVNTEYLYTQKLLVSTLIGQQSRASEGAKSSSSAVILC